VPRWYVWHSYSMVNICLIFSNYCMILTCCVWKPRLLVQFAFKGQRFNSSLGIFSKNTYFVVGQFVVQQMCMVCVSNQLTTLANYCTCAKSHYVTRSQVTGWNPLEGFTKSSCGKWDLEARSRLPTLERGRGSSWEPRD
jgi:hypothetical protein